MPIQRSITVYAANELTATAKENARIGWRVRQAKAIHFDVLAHAHTFKPFFAALGIQVDFLLYSGYSMISDSACFTGTYHYRDDWREALTRLADGDLAADLSEFGESLQTIASQPKPFVSARIIRDQEDCVLRYTVDTQPLEGGFGQDMYQLTEVFQCMALWLWEKLRDRSLAMNMDAAVDKALNAEGQVFDAKGQHLSLN